LSMHCNQDKNKSMPLEGIVILAPEQFEAAPMCTMLLADLGAKVIKLERPGHGDHARSMGPNVTNEYGDKVGSFFFRFNRNKKGIAVDLQKPKGKELFLKLARKADVVVENFSPGTMDKLGLGYEVLKQIKPNLIYASISGFGHRDSPYIDRPAFDLIGQAMSGLMYSVSNTGEPHWVGFPITDQISGIIAAMGIMAAIIQRQRTGEGQHVDVSLYDCTTFLNERWVNLFDATGIIPTRDTAVSSAPYGAFKVEDGYIAISGGQTPVWPRFCKAIGRMDLLNDENLKTMQDRAINQERLKIITEEWLKGKTKKEAIDWLDKFEVPVGPVQTVEEILNCPHLQARKMICEYKSPYSGKRRTIGNPIKLSAMADKDATAPPELGEHTTEILREMLNLSSEDIRELRAEGVIGGREKLKTSE
jgi:CoA:oxalate CoA-transferase